MAETFPPLPHIHLDWLAMHPLRLLLLVACLNLLASSHVLAEDGTPPSEKIGPFTKTDWPWWRGPLRNGTADPDQNPPLKWSEAENVLWKVAIPGKGHGSPIVVGDHVYLATSEDEASIRSVMCFQRDTGQFVWKTPVHEGSPTPPRNAKGTQASSTIACDGDRLFANFLHDGAMYTTALSMDGAVHWQTRVGGYVVHQGYGSSPSPHGPLVLVAADNKSGGTIAGLDRVTGKIVWKIERPQLPNYPSPVVLDVAGKTQMILTGCDLVGGFNPLTGEKLWEVPGATTECVTSTVTDGNLIYTSGGYPKNHVSAVHADGSGKLAWENGTRVYVPSMLIKDGYLYAVADAGFAVCWKADTGEERWKGRLGGTFSSSPVLVGDRIYATNESGESYVFRASPDEFQLLAENRIDAECFATPAICGGRIYMRLAQNTDGVRREFLYCLGAQE